MIINLRDKEFLKKRRIISCLLICLLSFFSLGSAWRPPRPPSSPPPSPPTSTIKGYIKDKVTNQPISGARISLESLFGQEKCSTFSDRQGYYELKELIFSLFGDWYVLKVSKSGYKTEKETKFFSNGQKYDKSKSLMPNKIIPPPPPLPQDKIPPAITLKTIKSPTKEEVRLSEYYTVSDNITPSNQIEVSGDNSPYKQEGEYSVTLIAKDKAGNIYSAIIRFTIDKTPPVVKITSPFEGEVFYTSEIIMTGTIDGVGFSEKVKLEQEGENEITKTAVDAAGNPSLPVSVKVYLYSGINIGPGGGTVATPDGSVSLFIPQGALDREEHITLLAINKESVKYLVPADRDLLSIVECKPHLDFKIPAELSYHFSEPMLPGTNLELGYRVEGEETLRIVGQSHILAQDNYKVTFSIDHFSTYGALSSLISQGAPIGAGVKVPLPDMLSGAFGHSIGIAIPPGRKGMQPSLALSYRSSNANSWVGVGYSLNPGYIVRSTRLGPASYVDSQDTFYLITDAGTTELVNLIDNLYQAKIESGFSKFFKENNDSWKVVGKDGSILKFGQTSDSKEASTQGTFAWYLTKVVDTNGNYVEYNYTKDQGKSYLNKIDYTGNEMGISPTNSVEFGLESREDISSSYISGARIATAKRLKEIEVKVNGELAWRYELEYAYSPDTNRSLLKVVKQYGADGKSLPEQRFGYQGAKMEDGR